MIRQDDENLTVKERELVALLREMVEKIHPPDDHPSMAMGRSAREQLIRVTLKHYRLRALNILRGHRRRSVKLPA